MCLLVLRALSVEEYGKRQRPGHGLEKRSETIEFNYQVKHLREIRKLVILL